MCLGDIQAPPWCVLSMLCNTTHVKTMSLTTFGILQHPPASGNPTIVYSFFPCELSSAVGCQHPYHQGKDIVTQQDIVLIWPSTSGSRGGNPKVPFSMFSLQLLLLKIYASDEDRLDPTLTHRNLYSALTKASST